MTGHLSDNKYRKESFDRFGDDFCEFILSYLTLTEKLKYECVCSQWQRLVFSRQNSLHINGIDGYNSVQSLTDNELQTKYYNIFTINNDNMKSLLKKCLNLKCIEIDWKCIFNENSLALIADNCPLLERFIISSTEHFPYSERVIHHFGQSCGKSLKYFKTDDKFNGNFKLFLTYCSNLRSIEALNDCQNLIVSEPNFLPKLQSFDYLVFEDLDLKYFESLADKYENQLKKLSITIKISDSLGDNQLISSDLNKLFQQISRFKRLETLRVNLKSYFGKSFVTGIEMIGQNCKQLKYFDFETYDTIILENIFNLFKNFTELEYLSLNCRYIYKYETVVSVGQTVNYGSVTSLENCRHLRHFRLNLLHLNDSNLENIHTILPKLESIELKSSKNISDSSIEWIAKLDRLKHLRVFCGKSVNNHSISHLFNRRPVLSDIYFDGLPDINKNCLNILINNSINNPKVNYKLYYSGPPVPLDNIPVPINLKISNFWDKHWY